jgi:hypothetical protein
MLRVRPGRGLIRPGERGAASGLGPTGGRLRTWGRSVDRRCRRADGLVVMDGPPDDRDLPPVGTDCLPTATARNACVRIGI